MTRLWNGIFINQNYLTYLVIADLGQSYNQVTHTVTCDEIDVLSRSYAKEMNNQMYSLAIAH